MGSKVEVWQLSSTEFYITFLLSDSAFSLNSYQIHGEILRRILTTLYNTSHGMFLDKKNKSEIIHFSILVHSQSGSPFIIAIQKSNSEHRKEIDELWGLYNKGDSKSIRVLEKRLRKFADIPSYDRIVRSLNTLKKDNLVVSRESGKSIVWGMSQETRREVTDYVRSLPIDEQAICRFFK